MATGSATSTEALFGRAAELAWLVDRLSSAVAGRSSLVLVVGEAGIGKSRLVDEVTRIARTRAVRVLRSDATPSESAPLALWTGITRGAHLNRSTAVGLDRRWEILEWIAANLIAAAPAVVVLEDIHWADESSIWLLERIVGALAEAPVLLLVTARRYEPGTADLSSIRRSADVLELTGLNLASTIQLVEARSERTASEAEYLWTLTGGNPLFVRELLVFPPGHDRIPDAVSELLDRVLAGLPAESHEALAALAVTGGSTPLGVLERALGRQSGELLEILAPAVTLDVLTDATVPAFRHDLLRAAATRVVPPSRVRELHAALAIELERESTSPAALAQAARHRLAALPAGDAAQTAKATLRSMRRLSEAGDHAGTADVGAIAVDTLDRLGGAPTELTARLALEAADALTTLGEGIGATPMFERAAALLSTDDDVVLRTRAEVGASRHANVFVPDAARFDRLSALEAVLPAAASPLRVELLGRMAVVAASIPGRRPAAHRLGDDAVTMARELDEPALLVRALADRHLAPFGPEGVTAREAAGDEIAALGARAGRPDVELLGLEWLYEARLDRGDRDGANRALARWELLAELVPSPFWRYSARLRRATLHIVDGNRSGALRAITEASHIGEGIVDDVERLGLELDGRINVLLLWPGHDDRAEELLAVMSEHTRSFEAPFVKVHMALAAAVLGDTEPAVEVVARYGAHAETLIENIAGVLIVTRLAEVALWIGERRWLGALRNTLRPYGDRLAVGSGASVHLPIPAILGRLALLEGDTDAAIGHLHDAVELVAAMPSPILLAHCAHHLAEAHRASGDATAADTIAPTGDAAALAAGRRSPEQVTGSPEHSPRSASMRRHDSFWEITSPHGSAHLPATVGMTQLARLLGLPGVPLSAVVLADTASDGVLRDLGPALDARAKHEFRQRITELREDIDEAEANNDLGRLEAAESQLEAVMAALRSAVGLGGRNRPQGSGTERARVNVTRNLRRAISLIGQRLPALGAHLERSIRTGGECCYDPEPATARHWEISP